MPEIILESSGWWLLPVSLVSLLFTLWLYRRDSHLNNTQRIILSILRFLIFAICGLLLLSPLIRQEEEQIEKPFLVWLEDHSQSMINSPDSTAVRNLTVRNREEIESLRETYQLRVKSFSMGLLPETDSFYTDGTNLEEALQEIQDQYYNRNLAGVVLFSDGIYNRGADPAYVAENLPFPVYSLISGDSTLKRDLLLERVVHNQISYLENEFPVEVYVRARAMAGENYTLKIYDANGRQILSDNREIEGQNHFERLSFTLKAEAEGFQQYTVTLESSEGDEPLHNNRSVFSIEVLSNRKKILILASAPHPDLAALGNAIRGAKRYEVTTETGSALPGNDEFDLVILHNPKTSTLKRVHQDNRPYWLLLGDQTNTADFSLLDAGSRGYEESQVYWNQEFDLFTLTEMETEMLGELPPIWAPFGTPVINGNYFTLLYKRIGSIRTTDPAWLFRYDNRSSARERRSSILLGTGLWRWRIFAYRQNQSFNEFDNLVLKAVQFLTTRSNNKRFDVDIANRFSRSEKVIGEARLYNSSLELINDPEVNISFVAEDGRNYDFVMARAGYTYRLNAGSLPPGIYEWKATTTISGENFTDRGKLLVEEELVELTDLVARPDVLRKIARASGGKAFTLEEAGQLFDALKENPEARSYRSIAITTQNLIESKWLFFLLLILMAAEWGLRKFFGRY